jgi:hypothetical protein
VERREYRFEYRRDEFVDGMSTVASGRFVREMLGDDGFASFLARTRAAFADRFPDPLHDFQRVWLGVGGKPQT